VPPACEQAEALRTALLALDTETARAVRYALILMLRDLAIFLFLFEVLPRHLPTRRYRRQP
jgi:hypothetical protein